MCSGTFLEVCVQFLDDDRLGLHRRWVVSFYSLQYIAIRALAGLSGVWGMYLHIVDAQLSDEGDFCPRYSRRFGILHRLQSGF
jgi:hypothetical protein